MTAKSKLFMLLAAMVAIGATSARFTPPSVGSPLWNDTLFVYPDSVWKAEGEIFQIGIHVSSGVAELMGYNIAVTFDSSVIEIVGVSEGSLIRSVTDTTFFWWFGAGSKTDSVHVNGAALGATVDGPGELFVLTFKALSHGVARTTAVRIAWSALRDGANRPIEHEVEDGFVGVSPAVQVESATWGAIKERFR